MSASARHEVWLVNLDPTVGAEIRKTRPAVILSPDETNRRQRTVIIAPLTSTLRGWPTRVPVRFRSKAGEVALDQLRANDKVRLVRRLGAVDAAEADRLLRLLAELFAP